MEWSFEKSKKQKNGNLVTRATIEEAKTKEAAGTIDTSSFDVNLYSNENRKI